MIKNVPPLADQMLMFLPFYSDGREERGALVWPIKYARLVYLYKWTWTHKQTTVILPLLPFLKTHLCGGVKMERRRRRRKKKKNHTHTHTHIWIPS